MLELKKLQINLKLRRLQWQGTEIDPTICKVSENFFQPDNLKVLVKLPVVS